VRWGSSLQRALPTETKVESGTSQSKSGTSVNLSNKGLQTNFWDRAGGIETHSRKADVRLPGKGNSNSHGARPVHLIITMIKWTRTSRLSIKNSLSIERHATFSFEWAAGQLKRLGKTGLKSSIGLLPRNHAKVCKLSRHFPGYPGKGRDFVLRSVLSGTSSLGTYLDRNVKRFRGGLVFKAHRLVYHSTLGLRVIIKKKKMM